MQVLNHLLYSLQGNTSPPEELLQFLKVDETLLDVADDLCDYEDDICKNSFNIYRSYVHLFGNKAELELIAYISKLEGHHAQLLCQLPNEMQELYQKD